MLVADSRKGQSCACRALAQSQRPLTIRPLSHETKSQGIATGRCTIGGLVVSTVEGTVGGALLGVGADGGVPFVARIAVRVASLVVDPAPVGIDGDLAVLGRARTAGAALLPGHLRVCLGCRGAHLLRGGKAQKGGECCELGDHLEGLGSTIRRAWPGTGDR